ncbi:hypothetical protein [Candidatus Absconditicoccus praedator]|uniref:hypothetical protein n=1 Tax=Candidatus Absconditicoccus praedator TaxID=2735562 RepID=UPI001E614670|nr:hypothetical protein [Candidatus Absconditicoccus praedator]UFX83240.1 hypothetical protein HLG78_03875 [Candidatus Absconditicoccus praedator]
MKAKVEKTQRIGKQRAHTATHLLHAQLEKIIPGTKQAGSLVDLDYLRFDFTTNQPLTNKQIETIEDGVNKIIDKAEDVETFETNINSAIDMGAKAFFEEKYQDIVRVVKVGEKTSIELCGGTHISNTSHIGAFKIISQEAVSSGVRRITAVVGNKLFDYAKEKEEQIEEIAKKLECTEKQIFEKLNKQQKELNEYKKLYETTKTQIIEDKINNLDYKSSEIFDKILNISNDSQLQGENFKFIGDLLKNRNQTQNILAYNSLGNFCIILNHGNQSAKKIIQENGIKGGGSDYFAQGKDPKIVDFVNQIEN